MKQKNQTNKRNYQELLRHNNKRNIYKLTYCYVLSEYLNE